MNSLLLKNNSNSFVRFSKKHLVVVSSNDKNSLNKFKKFLKKITFLNYKVKLKALKTYKQNISILKSPHVNKVAQEQFQRTKFQILLEFEFISNYYIFCLLFKQLKYQGLPNLNMKHLVVFDTSSKFYNFKKFLSFREKSLCSRKNKHPKTVVYLSTLDIIGESVTVR